MSKLGGFRQVCNRTCWKFRRKISLVRAVHGSAFQAEDPNGALESLDGEGFVRARLDLFLQRYGQYKEESQRTRLLGTGRIFRQPKETGPASAWCDAYSLTRGEVNLFARC